MVSTGIEPVADVALKFQELQKEHKLSWVVLKFAKKSEKSKNYDQIVVDQVGEKGSTFSDLHQHLPQKDVRFIIYDCHYTNDGGQKKEKVALISWADDEAEIKKKLLASSGFETLKKKFGASLSAKISIHEYDELTEKNITTLIKDECK